MADAKPAIDSIFCEALDRKSPEELARYLDEACGSDSALRAQVEELLNSHRAAGQFPGGPSASGDTTIAPPMSHPEKASLVKLRFFAGLTNAETAAAMEISDTTADRIGPTRGPGFAGDECRSPFRLDLILPFFFGICEAKSAAITHCIL